VITRQSGDTSKVTVAFGNRERGVLPIRAHFTFTDGSSEDYNYPAEVWSTNSVRYVRRYNFVGKTLAKLEIDPENRIPDISRANNTWKAPDQVQAKPVVP
jgi:hypothetical protein